MQQQGFVLCWFCITKIYKVCLVGLCAQKTVMKHRCATRKCGPTNRNITVFKTTYGSRLKPQDVKDSDTCTMRAIATPQKGRITLSFMAGNEAVDKKVLNSYIYDCSFEEQISR